MLALLMKESGTTLTLAGRLDLQLAGFDDDPRALFQVPESRRWLLRLQARLPWLGAWLDPNTGTAFQLVGALAPFRVVSGRPRMEREQVQAAVHIANYAVAVTRNLGVSDLEHVDRILGMFGIADLPAGFFDGVEDLAAELDEAGRRAL